ncbi:DUF2536 family protein [Paenibacillus sp. NPDC057967]|uniref:DUF2536 family protein n=1 Tax=Paenibacillus sp. NPDC057967 TaxID=3346293 RepID=UPI0036D826BB
MEFRIDLIDTKVECYEAYNMKSLEAQLEKAIEINKALMLDVHAVSHQTTFDPRSEKMLYSAMIHFRIKK